MPSGFKTCFCVKKEEGASLQTLPQALLTLVAVGQILAPPLVEINKTHATNPLWLGHARFHLVWQVFSHALSSTLALTLLWWSVPIPPQRFYVAASVLAAPLLSFVVAALSRRLYSGTLHDPNGIRPWPLSVGGTTIRVEMNLVLVIAGIVLLVIALCRFYQMHS